MIKALKKKERTDPEDKDYKQAFEKLKELITNEPVLAYPDFTKQFTITTDDSNLVIGAVLSKEQDLILCYSRTLNSELLAIVEACRQFRPYIYGRKFTIETDHKPLTWLYSLKPPNARLIR